MDFFVIGEEEIVIGFRFAGVEGVSVSSREEALRSFQDVTGAGIVRVLILTEEVSTLIEDEVIAWQVSGTYPLIVEIPGLRGPLPGKKTLLEAVREAIGVHV